MLIKQLLEKKNIGFIPDGTLFGLDYRVATKGYCPVCNNKLYKMRDKPFHYCKNKTHKKFIIKSDKVMMKMLSYK